MRSLLIVLAVAVSLACAGDLAAQRQSPQPSAASATTEALSPPASVDGWCQATNGTSPIALAVPPRFTASVLNRTRFVALTFIGGTTSTRACYTVGTTAPAAGTCGAGGANTGAILQAGQTATYAVARDLSAGGLASISVQANAGTDGLVCLTLGW